MINFKNNIFENMQDELNKINQNFRELIKDIKKGLTDEKDII